MKGVKEISALSVIKSDSEQLQANDELREMLRAARLRYEARWSQRKISADLGLSQSRVSKLLKQAFDSGLIEVRIHDPFEPVSSLERAIKERFEVRDVVIVPGPFPNARALYSRLGLYAARYLQRILRKGHVLGIAGGRTLHATATSQVFDSYIPVLVVPVCGGESSAEHQTTANGLAAVFANQLGGTYRQVPFPTFLEVAATRDLIMLETSAKGPLDLARQADVMLLGIGTLDTPVLTLPHIGPSEIDSLRQNGAVAEIAGHFLNAEGEPCASAFDERLIGISLDDVRGVRHVVAVAGGAGKTNAILSTLKSGTIKVLITDEPTARSLANGGIMSSH